MTFTTPLPTTHNIHPRFISGTNPEWQKTKLESGRKQVKGNKKKHGNFENNLKQFKTNGTPLDQEVAQQKRTKLSGMSPKWPQKKRAQKTKLRPNNRSANKSIMTEI